MKNIHILPTDKPSRLWTNNLRRRLELDEFPEQHPTNIAKHIYITNSEEIKEGDWFIRDGSIHKCFRVHQTDIEFLTSIDSVYCGSNTFWRKEFCKKIILTTDGDLIKDGVQAINDDFLEWFVKNPSCEWVDVKYQYWKEINNIGKYTYQIFIPKEEPKHIIQEVATHLGKTIPATLKHIENFYKELDKLKKEPKPIYQQIIDIVGGEDRFRKIAGIKPKEETLEEANWKVLGTKTDTFYEGAKWQQERMYSEEEVLEMLEHHTSYLKTFIYQYIDRKDMVENEIWFEQFKKK
jgi:hypothetical protein